MDRDLALEGPSFTALDLKAQVLAQPGRNADAAGAQTEALKLASSGEIYFYGDRLVREQKLDAAMVVFVKETTTHADRWLNWYGLARVQIAKGDAASARKSLQEALTRAPGPVPRTTAQRLLDKIGRG